MEVLFNCFISGTRRFFTSFRWWCLGNLNIARTGFGFVGPDLLWSVRSVFEYALWHLRFLASMPRPTFDNLLFIHVAYWVFFRHLMENDGKKHLQLRGIWLGPFSLRRCLYSCRHNSDVSAFSRKIKEVTTWIWHDPLTFSRINLTFMLKGHSFQDHQRIQ